VKYDFNVEDNGVFRMFTTRDNRYPAGSEVFNSYGRRDNRHLLMEYAFAIENNEWETALVQVRPCLDRGGIPIFPMFLLLSGSNAGYHPQLRREASHHVSFAHARVASAWVVLFSLLRGCLCAHLLGLQYFRVRFGTVDTALIPHFRLLYTALAPLDADIALE
jgi:hypothetical protein